MREPFRTENYRGYTIELHYDDNPISPREWDNLGRIVHWHRRYDLGGHRLVDGDNVQEWMEYEGAKVWLPVYIYDHSGITLNTTGFRSPWDSGQVGFIYATEEDIEKRLLGGWDRARVEEILRSEIETFDQYLRGDIYGFFVRDSEGEHLDSCWGYYGEDYCLAEAKATVDHVLTRRLESHAKQVKSWIRNRVPLQYRTPAPVA